jgi:hypothetical protein
MKQLFSSLEFLCMKNSVKLRLVDTCEYIYNVMLLSTILAYGLRHSSFDQMIWNTRTYPLGLLDYNFHSTTCGDLQETLETKIWFLDSKVVQMVYRHFFPSFFLSIVMALLFIVLLLHLVFFNTFFNNFFFDLAKLVRLFWHLKKKNYRRKIKFPSFFFPLKRISQNSEIFVAKDVSF